MSSTGIAPEVQKKLLLWGPQDRETWPKWYVWTGGWYELDGEATYYVDWGNLGDDATVFDIGCYEGKWLSLMCAKFPKYKYYGFEPAPRAFGIAKKRLYGECSVSLYNFGLGTQSGVFRLRDYNRDSATFMPPTEYSDPNYMGETNAQIMNISQFLESEDIQCIDLMVINIEGMEFELIPYIIEKGIVGVTKHFMIQWHSVVPNALARQQEIQTQLARTHHMVWNLGAWEAWQIGTVQSLDSSPEPSTCCTQDIS